MRTINPNEAKYIDSAAGIRIRFRLAGERFPPTIYYKIFTNRPVQDLGANAPRDYTRCYLRLKSAVDSNNKLNRFPQQGLLFRISFLWNSEYENLFRSRRMVSSDRK
jgi:hypothetical protein